MSDQELLTEISQMMEAKLNTKLDEKLKPIIEKLDKLEESQDETRSGVNSLLEWAEECSNVIKFPLPRIK